MIASSDSPCVVYMLSFLNGKRYIGVTVDLVRRFKEHRRCDTLVGRAIRKHGFPEVHVLAICSEEYAYDLERKIVERFDTISPKGYNLMEGGMGGSVGRYISDETRKKMSESHTGKPLSEDHCKNISRGLRENPKYDDWRKNIAKSCLGRVHSESARQKQSLALRGRKRPSFSAEWREAISKANKGRVLGPPSEDHKRKISEAQKLRWKKRKANTG